MIPYYRVVEEKYSLEVLGLRPNFHNLANAKVADY